MGGMGRHTYRDVQTPTNLKKGVDYSDGRSFLEVKVEVEEVWKGE